MAINSQIVNEALSRYDKIDLENIERSEISNVFNFNEIADTIRKIKTALDLINSFYDKIIVDDQSERNLANMMDEITRLATSVKRFQGNNPNAHSEYQQMSGRIQEIKRNFNSNISTIYAQAQLESLSPQKFIEIENEMKKNKSASESIRSEAERILLDLKATSGKQAVQMTSSNFLTESKHHKTYSKVWLFITVGFSLLMILATPYIFLSHVWLNVMGVQSFKPQSTYEIIQFTIFKLIIFSVSYLILYLSLKNYKIHKHLEIVNLHRHNTFQVYPLMVNAADGENKQIILREASHAIFDSSNSGYLDSAERDLTPPPVNLMGVVNKLIDKT